MSINKIPVKAFTAGDLALDTFAATSGQSEFTLSLSATSNSVIVYVNDVIQVPSIDYSVNGDILTFVSALQLDDEVVVRIMSRPSTFGTVEDGAISTNKLADNAVTTTKITDANITAAKLASSAISDKLGYIPVSPNDLNNAVANLVNSAPSTLDTLNELATALGNDANFATTITNSLAGKVSKSGDTMTNNLVIGNSSVSKGLDVTGHIGFNRNQTDGTAYQTSEARFQISRYSSSHSTPNRLAFEVYDTAGTSKGNAAEIESAYGQFCTPTKFGFRASDVRGGGQSAANLNISQWFTSTYFNIGGRYSTSGGTAGRFTAPISGLYMFGWNLFTQAATSTSSRCGVNVNGSDPVSVGETVALASGSHSILLYLNANDYVTLGTQGGTYTAYWYASGNHSNFWGYFIG